jgi:amino acid adenylation domain-containing protein
MEKTNTTETANYKDLWAGNGAAASTVDGLLREAVRRYPERTAVTAGEDSLTYAELWNFAALFRERLLAEGVQPGDRIGLAADRSAATVAAILGIVLAGACYVPVNFKDFPGDMLRRQLEQVSLRCWITDTSARELGAALLADAVIVPIASIRRPALQQPVSVPSADITPESPLYVMFTSGSTGAPKGVVVPHRAVARLVTGQSLIAFGPEQSFLLHSPLSFDASTLELWGSLLHGGRLVIAPAGQLGLNDYANVVTRQGVTTLWLTAAVFHLAAEHAPEMFAPLSQLLFGGDVIAPHHVERIRNLYPHLRMVNGYGPTENTTFTCCHVVPEDYRAEGPLPIGLPLTSTTVHVLDSQLCEVLPGEEGELVTGGLGVALGYLGLPEATAERFVPDTFSEEPNAKLYRTGDRVRQRADGAYEFLGRLDRQVKIAGHRVELEAVENVIANAPGVAEAAVVVLRSAAGEKQLMACVAFSAGAQKDEASLRAWLAARLAPAAIPQRWLLRDRLPVTANGKIDRKALQVECEAILRTESFVGNANGVAANATTDGNDLPAITKFIEHLWAGLLRRPAVGLDENFFDLGGTSLLLIEMHSRLQQRFTAVPSLVDLFTAPTPRLLAERLFRGHDSANRGDAMEQRGQRQRAAMMARRAMSNTRLADTAGKEGAR